MREGLEAVDPDFAVTLSVAVLSWFIEGSAALSPLLSPKLDSSSPNLGVLNQEVLKRQRFASLPIPLGNSN